MSRVSGCVHPLPGIYSRGAFGFCGLQSAAALKRSHNTKEEGNRKSNELPHVPSCQGKGTEMKGHGLLGDFQRFQNVKVGR